MKNLRIALLAIMVSFSFQEAHSANISSVWKAQHDLPDDQFLEQFPYDDVLKIVLTSPFEKVLATRKEMMSEGRTEVADHVLYEMCEHYLKSSPVEVADLAALKSKLLIAEQFSAYRSQSDSALEFIMNNIGDRFFGSTAYRIEEAVSSGTIDKDSESFQAVIEVMRRNKFTLNIPTSNSEKFWRHAKEGNWSYIWNRFRTRYLKDTVLVGSLLLNLLFLIRPLVRFLRKKVAASRKTAKEKKSYSSANSFR